MKNSIQFKLTLTFTALFTLAAGVAGGVSFYDTYRESYKLQDDMLIQLSNFINSSENPTALQPPHNNNARVYMHFERHRKQGDKLPPDFPQQMEDGFHTLRKDGKKYKKVNPKKETRLWYTVKNADDLYRTYVRNTPQGKIIITQENEYREKLAIRSAWHAVLPLLVLLPLVILLTIVTVRMAMKPVNRLSRKVEQRHEQNLTPLPVEKIPSEIRGFVVEINRLLERTNDFIQQQKRFIADASHELRSPMTALSLQVEQLTYQNLSNEDGQQLDQIRQSIQRNRNLLDQLLSFARIQNNKMENYTDFNVQTIFRRVIEDLLPLAIDKNQDLGVTNEQTVNFQGLETDFYLLVKTLVDNAIRYTPNGSRIDLSVQQGKNRIIIEVEDNGNGIPQEERKRVLDPFYRILGTEQQGSGLGLAIAAEIVKNYAGTLTLLNSVHFENGLLVRVELPY
ncbi:sensor histidine kinase [Rodentibacter haemolyticus]|uniref:histidine kinase n=1 Tax=Rodentibacter haemolyticus TaxID=2778911 RepID=A0ABX6UZK0_9PAST|nr:ATP-binding protein [Rodentibacter haemolyticus]QPB43572.1 GHKL domain-containing protein [Rodentibacter haemolyticus]